MTHTDLHNPGDLRVSEAQRRIKAQRMRPPAGDPAMMASAASGTPSLAARIFRRGPWENVATALIAIGVIMLMQPFSLSLFSYSFITILTGTVMFIIVSHFPE